ncbi:MAG: hypothetical protein ACLR94_15395 [Acutalibacteraceae bacterium]
MSADNRFTLEDILAEERRAREGAAENAARQEAAADEPEEAQEETAAAEAQPAAVPEAQADAEPVPVETVETPYTEAERSEEKRGKKKKRGLFGRRKNKKEEIDAAEEMYYGIQLKPIDEYTRSFDATGEITKSDEGFKRLFDENTAELDDEVAKDFDRLQRERRRRVAEAVENAGVDIDEVENELGIVAPVPVSAFAGDPYAKQHGIDVEAGAGDENLPEFQKAMLQDAQTRTMEIKLDPGRDTLGVQQAKVMPEVSEDSVRRILETVQETPADAPPEPEDMEEISSVRVVSDEPEEEKPVGEFDDVSSFSEEKQAELEAGGQPEPEEAPAAEAAPQPAKISTPVSDVTAYRKRDLPVHIINADVLQSALLSEARVYSEDGNTSAAAGRHRLKIRFGDGNGEEAPETTAANVSSDEQLDDYTGPADAKSVSHDLRATMHELTLRMLATGVSTVVLLLASFIAEAGFSPNNTDVSGAIGYTVVSLIFLMIAVGFCAKSLLNGLRALVEFRANSDSAAAVACTAVLIQTVCALFSSASLATGQVHLYAGIAAGILFLNSLGKLTMIRRIHSNFRFVASREQKYTVRIFDDYNTSLKLAGSSVVSQPAIAYQQKAGFLKRFLQISYEPDPAETASQMLAPVGLVASLLLCVVALVITKDASLAITALAASCCVCVAVTNMLAVNLPVSRLSHRLRRAGAMVSGYEAIKRMSAVNAVLVDSADLFPRGTVVLNGVKPFTEEGLEEAVLRAGALMQALGGPLCGVFEQVLSEHEGELPEVEKGRFEAGNGVAGTVDGSEILIGSRALLTSHGIEAPDQALESRYATGSRQVLYVAADGVLCAMFILTYNADRKKKAELAELELNGVSLLVRSSDANLTPQFIGRLFGIDASAVNVIGAETDSACDRLVTGQTGRADAYVATKGRVESMMSVVSACIDEKKNISFIVAMQNAAVVIGFVLVAFLTFIAGVSQISSFALFVYELFWIVAAVILPRFKNKIK